MAGGQADIYMIEYDDEDVKTWTLPALRTHLRLLAMAARNFREGQKKG